jgi:MoaA/NifB/PqqE/SkfB family radical SAM enzyme
MRYLTPAVNYLNMVMHDHLQIEPTTRCNLSCQTCPHRDGVPIVDITTATMAGILKKHHSIRQINLQGLGEPFMHPVFEYICEMASDAAPAVRTFTNGTITNDLAVRYLTGITVSLDTINPVIAAKIKGPSYNLGTVLDNILKYNSFFPTVVNFTQSHLSYRELPAVRDWCEAPGIELNVTRVQNWYAPGESLWDERHTDVLAERQMFGQMRKEKSACQWRNLRWYYYRADGVRNPCCRRMGYHEYSERDGVCDTCPD